MQLKTIDLIVLTLVSGTSAGGQLAGGARYTQARRPVALVWSEACDSRSDAQQREHALRRLSREQKLAIIAGAEEGEGG